MTALLDTALTLLAHGCSVIPIRSDGSKSPAVAWKQYTQVPADEAQVRTWFTDTDHGLGVVTGAVSGQLEMLEVEGRAAHELPVLRSLAYDSGLGDLWDLIVRGWVETSPSGGWHFHYRVTADVPGNTKLARRPATPDELAQNPTDRIKVLAETRGAGGQVVVAPTPGTHHLTGRPWTTVLGGPDTMPTITAEQRDAFHAILRSLDEMPAPADPTPTPTAPRAPGDGVTPGDDYENRTDWTDILAPAGWTHVTTRGRTRYWRRPGKTDGLSATTGHADDRDRLYVFTSSTEFEPERAYTKFGAYTLLHHGGDHTLAAKALAADGYGQRATALRPPADGDDLAGLIAPRTDGTGTPRPSEATDDQYARLVAEEAMKLRIRDDARALHEAHKAQANPAQPFDDGLLVDVLARPAEPAHRVEGLVPSDGGTLVVAQRKTGKSTLNLNLARALLTGEDFLGRFPVVPTAGCVAILNFEVSAAQMARWADDVGVPADRLYLVNLRGRRNPLTHPGDRAMLAERLRVHQVESLFVDPFGRAYTGKSQNDAGEVGAWLTDLDTFARTEAGVRDLILNAHAGWDAERTRGASALEDWADSIITLTKGKDDDDGRYMRAIGRDVELDEDGLDFDHATRTLTMAGTGSRRTKAQGEKSAFLISAVHGVIAASPGLNGSQVADVLRRSSTPFQRGDENKALAAAVAQGLLRFELGARGAKRYYPTDLPRRTPTPPSGAGLTYPSPPLYGGVGQQGTSQHQVPQDQTLGVA